MSRFGHSYPQCVPFWDILNVESRCQGNQGEHKQHLHSVTMVVNVNKKK